MNTDATTAQSSLVRTPVVTEAPQIDEGGGVVDTTTSEAELPPSLYRESNKVPYILELFEAPEIYKQFNLEEEINVLDDYIVSEIKRQGLSDTRESYKNVLDGIYTHVKATNDVYKNVGQLVEWVRLQNKLIQLTKEKEEFEKKPLEDMTSAELRKILYEQ